MALSHLARFEKEKNNIESYFDKLDVKVFKKKEIREILKGHYYIWNLSENLTLDKFVELLINNSKLKKIELISLNYNKNKTRYIWGNEVSVYQVALSIKPHSYLSHYSAMFLHNLTKQIPKTLYINTEQSKKPSKVSTLDQGRIDRAFQNKTRDSKFIFKYNDWSIKCHNGKNTNNLGVEEKEYFEFEKLFVTNIERTLIDIAVRPIYSGGIYEVFNAYKAAKGNVDVNMLVAMLKKIDFTYPYHQVIGFYMERAGYEESQLNLLKAIDMEYDFYIDYGMKAKDYSENWKLFFPKGF